MKPLKPKGIIKDKIEFSIEIKLTRHRRKGQVKLSRFYPFSMKIEIRAPHRLSMVNTDLPTDSRMKVFTLAPTFPARLGI